MTPGEVAEFLIVLKAAGVKRASIPTATGAFEVLLTGAPRVEAANPFTDSKGKPIDLDEGAPWNARDPIEASNFPGTDESP